MAEYAVLALLWFWAIVVRTGRPPTDGGLHAPASAVARPVERQHLHAVARRFADRRAEVRPVVLGNLAEHPHGRGADDAPGVVEPMNLKPQMLRVLRAVQIVDVSLDPGSAARPCDLPLE